MATALVLNVLLANGYSAPDGCNDLQNCRTMWSIVYGCLLTVFACVWTAAHPDIPEPSNSIWPPRKSRIGLMGISLVSPEAILATACYQFLLSWRISKKYKMVEGWTLTHSYFVAMDGFFDPSKGGQGKAVDPDDLQRYPGIIKKTGNTRKVAITKKEILNSSKGNSFSKFMIALQLLWFITQYVGRWASHLHRSQLETMTLAYAALSLFVYVFWWHKPVNIQFPIHVTNVDQPTPKTETDADPMPLVQVRPKDMELTIIFIATGMIFGGIHCLGCSFPFPTHTEMILWLVSAIYITVAPVFPIMLSVWAPRNLGSFGSLIILRTLLVYCAARVILLVLTFSSLRSPPPDLFQIPSWLSFLPHFG
ncbi:uncharacterized protein EI90DRAFT_3092902 [Cantharellus anzutake]|uniref:uncharacterized protein n=1 Tax=Cantharellus anzutake TaxID=1750568 RepID=UPI0019032BE0|nr:uncharacterized protein EI90DRAFT_3092902 [Cantharellus anzutake]KAF8312757.1 hypothetical protein EI90DRAFT_3092902 [Cantharellus anzutake]